VPGVHQAHLVFRCPRLHPSAGHPCEGTCPARSRRPAGQLATRECTARLLVAINAKTVRVQAGQSPGAPDSPSGPSRRGNGHNIDGPCRSRAEWRKTSTVTPSKSHRRRRRTTVLPSEEVGRDTGTTEALHRQTGEGGARQAFGRVAQVRPPRNAAASSPSHMEHPG
jgi:hypothetical protein